MRDPENDLKALLEKIKQLQARLEEEEQKAIADGIITEDEKQRISATKSAIAVAQAQLHRMLVPSTNDLLRQGIEQEAAARAWLQNYLQQDMELTKVAEEVKKRYHLLMIEEQNIKLIKEVAREKNISLLEPIPNPMEPKPDTPLNVPDIGKFLHFKLKYKGASIEVNLPSEIKAKLKIPAGTTNIDLELKANTDKEIIFALRFNHQEKLYFSFKTKYDTEKGKLTTGVYMSNTPAIFEKAPPQGISAKLNESGEKLAKALNKLQKDINDTQAQDEAGKAFDDIYTYMKYVQATYSTSPSFSIGIETVIPIKEKEPLPGGLPDVPTIGGSFILRF